MLNVFYMGGRNQKSEISEENSKLIRKRRDKKGEEKNGKKQREKGRKREKRKKRNLYIIGPKSVRKGLN